MLACILHHFRLVPLVIFTYITWRKPLIELFYDDKSTMSTYRTNHDF